MRKDYIKPLHPDHLPVRYKGFKRVATIQDLSRFYRTDFWGHLHRFLLHHRRLSHRLFRRRLRRSRRWQRASLLRAGRFELIKLDDQPFLARKRIAAHHFIVHNKERFRFYWGLTEMGLRHWMLASRISGGRYLEPGQKYWSTSLSARLDQFFFAHRFAPTLHHAQFLLRRALFTLNGHLVPSFFSTVARYDYLTFRSPSAFMIYRRWRQRWLRVLQRRLLRFFRIHVLLWRRRIKNVNRRRGRRSRFKIERFPGFRNVRRYRQSLVRSLIRFPRVRLPLARFILVRAGWWRAVRQFLSGQNFTPVNLFRALRKALHTAQLPVVFPRIPSHRFQFFFNHRRSWVRRWLSTHYAQWARKLVDQNHRLVRQTVGSDFVQGLRRRLHLGPRFRDHWLVTRPLFMLFFLGTPARTFYPARGDMVSALTASGRVRLRRLFRRSAVVRHRLSSLY